MNDYENDIVKLSDLQISNDEKKILAFLSQKRSLMDICAKFPISYSKAYTQIGILDARGLITKFRVGKPKKTLWALNTERVLL